MSARLSSFFLAGCQKYFLSLGEIEEKGTQEKRLRKILYQAYHMLKKVKFAQTSADLNNLLVCRVYRHKKHDRQIFVLFFIM